MSQMMPGTSCNEISMKCLIFCIIGTKHGSRTLFKQSIVHGWHMLMTQVHGLSQGLSYDSVAIHPMFLHAILKLVPKPASILWAGISHSGYRSANERRCYIKNAYSHWLSPYPGWSLHGAQGQHHGCWFPFRFLVNKGPALLTLKGF